MIETWSHEHKPNQTKANEVQQNKGKATKRNTMTQDSQILHSLPLWHRDTKKAERTPRTQVVAPIDVITHQAPHLSQQQEWTPHLTQSTNSPASPSRQPQE